MRRTFGEYLPGKGYQRRYDPLSERKERLMETYEKPVMEIVELDDEDVVCSSCPTYVIELPEICNAVR